MLAWRSKGDESVKCKFVIAKGTRASLTTYYSRNTFTLDIEQDIEIYPNLKTFCFTQYDKENATITYFSTTQNESVNTIIHGVTIDNVENKITLQVQDIAGAHFNDFKVGGEDAFGGGDDDY